MKPTNSPHQKSPIVQKGLEIILQNKQKRDYLKWGGINVLLLSLLLLDIINRCPYSFSYWYYVEYVAAILLSLSITFYLFKYLFFWITFEPVNGTVAQQKLLHFDDGDSSFIVKSPDDAKRKAANHTNSPINNTMISWHSSFADNHSPMWSTSFNRSPAHHQQQSFNNSPYSSPTRPDFQTSFNASPNQSLNNTFSSPYKTYAKDEIITDELGLQRYLKEVAKEETNALGTVNYSEMRDIGDRNPINTLWNYCNNAANLLKTSTYQLSPTTVSSTKQSTGKEYIGKSVGPGCSDMEGVSAVMKTISSSKLTQYVTNLRLWISATILQRLVIEFDKINAEFSARGFSDIKIGKVGLERLRKTAENQTISMHVPSLPMVVPFLSMSSNQDYLVQRVRELAKGSGINDYRWDSSNSYDLNWDEHVPTDAAIIFYLFCAYMDSQLMPLPQPGGRPFYDRYVVFGDKKAPKETIEEVRGKTKFAILCTNPSKPKFNFICHDKIHHCNHDRNNVFCVIIHFLIYVREQNAGLLDGVNLGRSGLNILGVIED